MSVKAKFQCVSVIKFTDQSEKVEFTPVYGNGEENKQWSKYTPSGQLWMNINADGAIGLFQPGKEYYLTFEEAVKA